MGSEGLLIVVVLVGIRTEPFEIDEMIANLTMALVLETRQLFCRNPNET